jgi:CHAT domain-containing protein
LYEEHATRSELLQRLPGATYIHLACHGVFDMTQPLRSHLRLGGGQRLLLSELLDQQLFKDADLVVLSACQTAMIDFSHLPDEAIGLPTASLQAGAPRVLGSLWPVNDASTALLMEAFYRCLLLGVEGSTASLPPAAALRLAQRRLRSATAGELELGTCWERVYEASAGSDAEAFQRARYFKRHPSVQPFREPYYWAAFVLSGA